MRIEINTNGDSSQTSITINGVRIDILKEFHLSIHHLKKVKLQMVKEIDKKVEFISYYGEDFKKFDEVNNAK